MSRASHPASWKTKQKWSSKGSLDPSLGLAVIHSVMEQEQQVIISGAQQDLKENRAEPPFKTWAS